MSKPRVTYVPRRDVAPEQARDLRARAWTYVFGCYEAKKKAGERDAGDGTTKGSEHDVRPEDSIRRQRD